MTGVILIYLVSCTLTVTEYDGKTHARHVPYAAYLTEAAAQTAVTVQNAAKNPKANRCDYAHVPLNPTLTPPTGTPELDPDAPDTVVIILRTQTAVDWVNALVVALGMVPPALPCPPDPHAGERGVRPANPPCPSP